ncbi:MAG: DUF488 domain-containing protein [Bacteroidales bacterium]|nr:DUF488 domain-containing protein [Bacteroidales bacterium]
MYYRRKVILSLLELFNDQLEKLQLQRLLMLLSFQQTNPSFYFVPHKLGGISFQANADLSTMKKYRLLDEEEKYWKRVTNISYTNELKREDLAALNELKEKFLYKSSEYLIRYVYKYYPYYAINSKVTERSMSYKERSKIADEIPHSSEKALFTIGYEGVTIEQYINKLIKRDVKVLCDVRKNSFSMKYGFNKSQLKMVCEGVGIMFIHIPELGIVSSKRKELKTQEDYDTLFGEYKKTVLKETLNEQKQILDFIEKHKRVALTCFEKDKSQCHRTPLAEAVSQLSSFKYEVKHL